MKNAIERNNMASPKNDRVDSLLQIKRRSQPEARASQARVDMVL